MLNWESNGEKEAKEMHNPLYDNGFGVDWTEQCVYRRDSYLTSVLDFHEHEFYEINLLLSGRIRVLFPNRYAENEECCAVLTAPGTPHYISCDSNECISRLYLCFSHDFIANFSVEARHLLDLFGESGAIVRLSEAQREECRDMILRIDSEENRLRRQLLILFLLSRLNEFAGNGEETFRGVPRYITDALTYIDDHFAEKLTAESLARQVGIGRTTLMLGFRSYTGSTLNGYLVNRRLRYALRLLKEGKNVQEAAERSGFNDSSNLIRSFKKVFGSTPKQYLMKRDPI